MNLTKLNNPCMHSSRNVINVLINGAMISHLLKSNNTALLSPDNVYMFDIQFFWKVLILLYMKSMFTTGSFCLYIYMLKNNVLPFSH